LEVDASTLFLEKGLDIFSISSLVKKAGCQKLNQTQEAKVLLKLGSLVWQRREEFDNLGSELA